MGVILGGWMGDMDMDMKGVLGFFRGGRGGDSGGCFGMMGRYFLA